MLYIYTYINLKALIVYLKKKVILNQLNMIFVIMARIFFAEQHRML